MRSNSMDAANRGNPQIGSRNVSSEYFEFGKPIENSDARAKNNW